MNSPLQRHLEQDAVYQQAADWLVELQSGEPALERIGEWQRWLAADERHSKAYDEIESLWCAVDQVSASTWPRAEEVFADGYDGEQLVSQWLHAQQGTEQQPRAPHAVSREPDSPSAATGPSSSRRFNRRGFIGAMAAGIGALAIGLSFVPQVRNLYLPSSIVVTTEAGERRTMKLSDGSVVTVGGLSTVTVDLSEQSRDVRLESGEAFFKVAKDASRPFTVHAGAAAFTAVGTAFNVRRAADHVVIAIAEGIVDVGQRAPGWSESGISDAESTGVRQRNGAANEAVDGKSAPAETGNSAAGGKNVLRLTAGQQLSIEAAGAAVEPRTIDTAVVGSWRSGKLHYIDEPLESVIADIRRYSALDIEIADTSLGSLRITGTVFEHDVDSWLSTLEAAFPIRVERRVAGDGRGDGRVVLRGLRD